MILSLEKIKGMEIKISILEDTRVLEKNTFKSASLTTSTGDLLIAILRKKINKIILKCFQYYTLHFNFKFFVNERFFWSREQTRNLKI